MKKHLMVFLLLAGTATGLHAQYELPNTYGHMFDSPKPGKGNGSFKFYFPGMKTVMIELEYASQLNYLPNLDSVLQSTIQLLEPLKDSLKADGIVRRVDIVYRGTAPAIRILSHPEYANTYTIKDKELMQLKVNKDTVRIVLLVPRRMQVNQPTNSDSLSKPVFLYPFVITLLVNNVEDIANTPPGALSQCKELLRTELHRFTKSEKNEVPIVYRTDFNMATNKKLTPMYTTYQLNGEQGFNMIMGFGLHTVRGAAAPFAEVGIEYAKSNAFFTNRFRLTTELQTFFSRGTDQKLQIFRNTFVDFGFRQTDRPFEGNKLQFVPNFSLGYLVRREGEWYEKNTFRFTMPQLAGRNLSITPYIVFNDFFKNTTLGFKFCFNF